MYKTEKFSLNLNTEDFYIYFYVPMSFAKV